MHSPQCPTFEWAQFISPAPQSKSQTEIAANSVDFPIGEFDAAVPVCVSTRDALITVQYADGTKVFIWSNTGSGLTVVVPWQRAQIFVTELAGKKAWAWTLTLEKLEPPTDR